MIKVHDAVCGVALTGIPSTSLVSACVTSVAPRGSVYAYQRRDGTWLPCPRRERDLLQSEGYRVECVYITYE